MLLCVLGNNTLLWINGAIALFISLLMLFASGFTYYLSTSGDEQLTPEMELDFKVTRGVLKEIFIGSIVIGLFGVPAILVYASIARLKKYFE